MTIVFDKSRQSWGSLRHSKEQFTLPSPVSDMRTEPAKAEMFSTTHWSVVLAIGQDLRPTRQAAAETLCCTYWYPLYAYIRRQGYRVEDAEDLTQGFFARLLEKSYLAQVDRQKGRFRSFLLACLRHFLADQRDFDRAVKRGGRCTFIPLETQTAEDRYLLEPIDEMNAEKIFERRWALTLLESAEARLRHEYVAAGKSRLYECLKIFRTDPEPTSPLTHAELGGRLNMTESAVRCAAARLRRRFRELVREEVAQTVTHSSEIDEEIRYLIAVISG
jgi:RNA polymerase sigma-70 factor (ECF subfamily)